MVKGWERFVGGLKFKSQLGWKFIDQKKKKETRTCIFKTSFVE